MSKVTNISSKEQLLANADALKKNVLDLKTRFDSLKSTLSSIPSYDEFDLAGAAAVLCNSIDGISKNMDNISLNISNYVADLIEFDTYDLSIDGETGNETTGGFDYSAGPASVGVGDESNGETESSVEQDTSNNESNSDANDTNNTSAGNGVNNKPSNGTYNGSNGNNSINGNNNSNSNNNNDSSSNNSNDSSNVNNSNNVSDNNSSNNNSSNNDSSSSIVENVSNNNSTNGDTGVSSDIVGKDYNDEYISTDDVNSGANDYVVNDTVVEDTVVNDNVVSNDTSLNDSVGSSEIIDNTENNDSIIPEILTGLGVAAGAGAAVYGGTKVVKKMKENQDLDEE